MSIYSSTAIIFIVTSLLTNCLEILVSHILHKLFEKEINKIMDIFNHQVSREPKLPLIYWSQLGNVYWMPFCFFFDLIYTGIMIWFIYDNVHLWGYIALIIIFISTLIILINQNIRFFVRTKSRYGTFYTHKKGGKQFQLYLDQLPKPVSFIDLIDCNSHDKKQTYNTLMNRSVKDIKKIKKKKRSDGWKIGKFASLYIYVLEFYLDVDINDCFLEETSVPITKQEYGDIIENNFVYLWLN